MVSKIISGKDFFKFFSCISFFNRIECSLVLQNFINCPYSLYYFCRNASSNAIWRYIFVYDSTGSYSAASSYSNAA